MANYTKEEIQVFLDYEKECELVSEMFSEQTAEAWMNAKSLGMDRPSPDALPNADDFEIPVPDGYSVFFTYYEDHFHDSWDWDLVEFHDHVKKSMVAVTHEQAQAHYERKAEEEARALEVDRDPDWDEWIEPPF